MSNQVVELFQTKGPHAPEIESLLKVIGEARGLEGLKPILVWLRFTQRLKPNERVSIEKALRNKIQELHDGLNTFAAEVCEIMHAKQV